MTGILDISYAVSDLSKFSDIPAEWHYVVIRRVVRYLIKDPEKVIIWWSEEPKITLPVRSIVPKVYIENQEPGAINPCEDVTYIDASHDTCLRYRISVGYFLITVFG